MRRTNSFTNDEITLLRDLFPPEPLRELQQEVRSQETRSVPPLYLQWSIGRCEKCNFPKFQIHRSGTGTGHSRRWSKREDIFLGAAVLHRYFRCHSLSPSRNEQQEALDNNESTSRIVWRKIHGMFKKYAKRFYQITGVPTPERSVDSLQKRWKLTSETNTPVGNQESHSQTQENWREWFHHYNRGRLLSCSDNEFRAHLQRMDIRREDCCED